jgi:hypothetical protein
MVVRGVGRRIDRRIVICCGVKASQTAGCEGRRTRQASSGVRITMYHDVSQWVTMGHRARGRWARSMSKGSRGKSR